MTKTVGLECSAQILRISPGFAAGSCSPRYENPRTAWADPQPFNIGPTPEVVNTFSGSLSLCPESSETGFPAEASTSGSLEQPSHTYGETHSGVAQERPRTAPRTAARAIEHANRLHTAPPTAAQRRAVSERSEWSVANNKMKQTERLLAKCLASAASSGQEVAALVEQGTIDSARSQSSMSRDIGDRLYCIKQCVSRLSSHVEDVQKSPAYVAALERLMEQGNKEIARFKAMERETFEELFLQETELLKEVDAFAARLHDWETSSTGTSDAASGLAAYGETDHYAGFGQWSKPTRTNKELRQPDEVAAFQRLHDLYGPFGGWDEPDHKHFKKILARCAFDYGRATEVAAVEMQALFSRKAIIQHARWDAEYEDLQTKKRVAIQAWRLRKEEVKSTALAQVEAETVREAQEARAEAAVLKEQERREQRRQLDAWRAEKAAKAKAEEEATRAQEVLDERERKRRLKEKKDREAAFKARRDEEEAVQKMRAQERAALQALSGNKMLRTKPAPEDLERMQRLQERDAEFVARRRAAVTAKDRQAAELKQRQELIRKQVDFSVKRDPSRLLKQTEAIQNRLNAEAEPEALFKEKPQHWARAPAGWRAGL